MRTSKLVKIILGSLLFLGIAKELSNPNISKSFKFKLKNKTIVLDPGHDNVNKGTGVEEERTLTLDLAKKLRSKWIQDGYNVYLTREDENPVNKDSIDYNLDGKINIKDERLARKQFGKDKDADYFLSIHYNANYINKAKKGMGLFVPGYRKLSHSWDKKRSFCKEESLKYYCKESFDLAKKMAECIKKNDTNVEIYGTDVEIIKNSRIDEIIKSKSKKKYSKIIRLLKDPDFKADFPNTLLIEVEYLTHKQSRKYSNTEEGREFQSNLIYNAFKFAVESEK